MTGGATLRVDGERLMTRLALTPEDWEARNLSMVFIRCRDGISHNPAESILPEDATAGAQVLLDAVRELAAD